MDNNLKHVSLYVYLKAINYNKYGGDASRALSSHKASLKINNIQSAAAQTKIIKPLESILNQVFYDKPTLAKAQLEQAVVQEIKQAIEKDLKKIDSEIVMNWYSGTPEGQFLSGLPKITSTKYLYVDTVARRFNDFDKMINKWAKRDKISQAQLENLSARAQALKQDFLKAAELESEDLREKNFKQIKLTKDVSNIRDKMNTLFASSAVSRNKVIGEILEKVGILGVEQIAKTVEKDLIKVRQVGKDNSKIELSTKIENIYDDNCVEYKINDFVSTEVRTKKNKADILVQINDLKFVDTKSIGFSAKNYYSDTLRLVDETPLLDVLQAQGGLGFATHYLNLSVPGRKKRKALTDYRQELKRTLAVTALQGIVADTEGYSADYLILNDRKARQVSIVSIGNILSNLVAEKNKSKQLFLNIDEAFTFTPSIESIYFQNKEENKLNGPNMTDALLRTNNLLREARQVKLTATMKKKYVTTSMRN